MQKFDQSVTVNAVKVERTDVKVELSKFELLKAAKTLSTHDLCSILLSRVDDAIRSDAISKIKSLQGSTPKSYLSVCVESGNASIQSHFDKKISNYEIPENFKIIIESIKSVRGVV
ncbi:hypothetical protein [Kosakonia phage Kc304]|uniref:Uncharacterized protein n=2 Tax=Winklervirus chi14 TaxID=2560752 RepID=A0A1Z1LY27_9CAUD|nr:hypothetical protein FDI23_gp028 [Serratia phage CHI14]ARW57451.1 hypothetical protein [Serratia phage CHI14]ARW57726.1 hypothetical protein [Serratia phage CBH8]QYN80473.1 hypothetical protein [Kosakonia phage Kc304]